jgi:hypothetical protein
MQTHSFGMGRYQEALGKYHREEGCLRQLGND